MAKTHNKSLLFNWIFIFSMTLLALNDHYLKAAVGNWLTGKISDFAGLLILPMFLLFIIPKLNRLAFVISGLFFIFWKLPLSQNFIDQYNQIALIPITRTVDYTDLVALFMLPVSYLLTQYIHRFEIPRSLRLSLHPALVLVPCSFIFMATSPPISYYMKPGGDIHIGKSYRMKVSKEKILQKLSAAGFTIMPDTSQAVEFNRADNYRVDNVIIGRDTIRSIQFGFIGNNEKPLLFLNNISLPGEKNLSDWRTLKRYARYYRRLIDSEIIEELK
jgi:hypothetical protein